MELGLVSWYQIIGMLVGLITIIGFIFSVLLKRLKPLWDTDIAKAIKDEHQAVTARTEKIKIDISKSNTEWNTQKSELLNKDLAAIQSELVDLNSALDRHQETQIVIRLDLTRLVEKLESYEKRLNKIEK